MSESKRKHLDKSHPDCAEYAKRFNELWDSYLKVEKEEEAKYPNWNGLDHPAAAILRPLHKKLLADIKELKKEYFYLFIEEE